VAPQNNYMSNITDHLSQITITGIIITKSLKYCEYCQNVTQRHEVSTCCWKNGADGPARRRVAINLQLKKKRAISGKRNKARYVCMKLGKISRHAYFYYTFSKHTLSSMFSYYSLPLSELFVPTNHVEPA
jgi:hypothetical protein